MKVWIMGARPRTLPAAIAPVIVGSALAGSQFDLLPALLALVVSLFLQIGVNYANDYSDGIRGTDNNRIGPTRITASGLAAASSVKRAAFISFGIAAIAGLALAAMSTWWLIAVGLAAIIAGWGYTGGKNPYGYLGLGEVFVFLFFGVVATTGTYFVQVEKISNQAWLASLSMGAFACALLAINNIRDRAQDILVGKRTLAVRLGDSGARRFFIALITFGYITGIAISFPWSLMTLASLLIAIPLIRLVQSGVEGKALIPALAATGKLQMMYSILLTLALLAEHL